MAALPCRNCGTPPGAGEFCAGCGQRNRHSLLRSRELLEDVFEQIVEWRLPWPRTMLDLSWRAGAVALDYVEGRRARYVNPVKYCFIIVAIAWAFTDPQHDSDPYLVDMPANLLALLSIPYQVMVLRLCFWRSPRTPTEISVLSLYVTAQLLLFLLVIFQPVANYLSEVAPLPDEGSFPMMIAVPFVGLLLANSVYAIRTFFGAPIGYAIFTMFLTGVTTTMVFAEVDHLLRRGELSTYMQYALSGGT